MYTCIYVYMYTCIYVYMNVCVRTYTHTHTHTHTHTVEWLQITASGDSMSIDLVQ